MRSGLHDGRRRLLKGAGALTGALGAGVGRVVWAASMPDEALAFAAHGFSEAIAALGGVPKASALITLDLPEVADNGALVPITVTSALAGTREILVVVDGNPQPVAVRFSIPEGTEPYVATRIRLAKDATVYAAVRTDDGLYGTARATRVIVGGCA